LSLHFAIEVAGRNERPTGEDLESPGFPTCSATTTETDATMYSAGTGGTLDGPTDTDIYLESHGTYVEHVTCPREEDLPPLLDSR